MLIAEYKRDMTRNYLILRTPQEADTGAYQIRMLLSGKVPGLLKCHMEEYDGVQKAYYEITSRQAIGTLFENRQLEEPDLRLIFQSFVKIMQTLSEYLLSPSMLILQPEYIYADAEQKDLFFCCLPGFEEDIRRQFQKLTEYLLPKLNHQDESAVMLGYGIYRKAMEDAFHLEHIKEVLYRDPVIKQGRSEPPDRLTQENGLFQNPAYDHSSARQPSAGLTGEIRYQEASPEQGFSQDLFSDEKNPRLGKKKGQNDPFLWSKWVVLAGCGLAFAALVGARLLGFLPMVSSEILLGAGITLLAGLVLTLRLLEERRKKQESKQPLPDPQTSSADIDPSWNASSQSAPVRHGASWNTIFPPDSAGGDLPGDPAQSSAQSVNRPDPSPSPRSSSWRIPQESGTETLVLTAANLKGPSSLVSREPGELPTIFLTQDLTIVGKLENAADAVIDLPTISRVHARIRRKEEGFYLADLNSKNGTCVNGHILKSDEEWRLNDQDEVDFAQARYIFLE